jgi:predicted hotdog family 3-hydroxylacyl-ACP dehydratase
VGFPPIAALVPHRAPMLLVDELVSQEGRAIVCRATIREDHPFLSDGEVSVLVAVELFAQTAAALVGLLASAGGPSMQSGALLGSREVLFSTDALHVGDVLDIRCEEVWTVGPAAQVVCALYRDGVKIAEGSINVMAGDPQGAAAAKANRKET